MTDSRPQRPPRLPSVYALPEAREAGVRLLGEGSVPEHAVAKAIFAGRATRRPLPGRTTMRASDRVVWSGQGWAALVTRCRGPLGRPGWLILRMEEAH